MAFYTHGSYPAAGAAGSSASMRAELDSIAAAFAKLYDYTGHSNILLKVNSAGTGYAGSILSDDGAIATVAGALSVSGHLTLEGVTSTGATGTGKLVFDGSPTLVTPTLGVATATSINKVTITAPATSATLTVANGKTLTASNTLTLAGTDGTTLTFQGTDTYVGRDTTDTLTNKSISGSTNTLSNIGNAALTNSSLTIGSTSVSLGGTAATVAGLTLTSPTINGTIATTGLTLPALTLSGNVGSSGNPSLNIGTGALTAGAITSSAMGTCATFSPTSDSSVLIARAPANTRYNLISLNGDLSATHLGIMGGHSTDKTLYIDAPSTGKVSVRIAESAIADISSTGLSLGSLALTAGSGTFSGRITHSATAATNTLAFDSGDSTTGANYYRCYNTSAQLGIGIEGAAGGVLAAGTAPYNVVIASQAGNKPIQLAVNNAVVGTFSSTGLAVTGTLSATTPASTHNYLTLTSPSTSYDAMVKCSDGTNNWFAGLYGSSSTDGAYRIARQGVGTLATLDASGNLGLGVTPVSTWNSYNAFQLSTQSVLAGTAGYTMLATNWYNSTGDKFIGTGYAAMYYQNAGKHIWRTSTASGTAGNPITFTDAMTLDASGNLYLGTASRIGSGVGSIGFVPGTSQGLNFKQSSDSSSPTPMQFMNAAGTVVGSVTTTGAATAFNTSSDQRLKDNIIDSEESASIVDSLQVRGFDWKVDGKHQRYGFIAQELVQVFPEAVHQPEDPEAMMAVDYSKLVPLLVKEIQSLRSRIAQLEAK